MRSLPLDHFAMGCVGAECIHSGGSLVSCVGPNQKAANQHQQRCTWFPQLGGCQVHLCSEQQLLVFSGASNVLQFDQHH